MNFDRIESKYVNKTLSNPAKNEIRKQLLLATEKDESNLFTEFYKAENLIIKEYLYPMVEKLKNSKIYYISNTSDEKVEALLMVLQNEEKQIKDQYILFESYNWEAEVLKKSKIKDDTISSNFIEIQMIDESENLVQDTVRNFNENYSINGDFTLSKINTTTSKNNSEKIIDEYNYDFNFDNQIDKVQLIEKNTNKIIIRFFQNNKDIYHITFESEIPHQHVYFEKEKSTKERGLAISLVEKQQSIIEYIKFNSSEKIFNVKEVCHSINEITPIGYNQKEKCKTSNVKISNLTFIKALEMID